MEKINWNPFTNQSLTTEQIQELDTSGDGVVSNSELVAKWSWLSEQSTDMEVGVDFSSQNPSLSGSVSTQQELLDKCVLMYDSYLEHYFSNNLSLSEEERDNLNKAFNVSYNEFINSVFATNELGPWDMAQISADFIKFMDSAMKSKHDALNAVNNSINSYTDNIDTNKSLMLAESFTADENNYVTESEWGKVRNNTVSYLMGMLLSGDIDNDFLLNLNSKYASNSNYKEAMKAINELKICDDPVKMQQLLTDAHSKIVAFVTQNGKDKTVDALNSFAEAEGINAVNNVLTNYIDSYIEEVTTAEMTDNDKAQLQLFVNNCLDKYMARLVESGTINEMTEDDLKRGFSDFLTQQSTQLVDAQTLLFEQTTKIDEAFNNLVSVSDSANSNGNISQEERSAIIDASKNLILNQLLSGNTQIEMLEQLGATSELLQMTSLVQKIWTELNPDKLAEYQKELEELIKTTLEKYSGSDLVNAVNSLKPMEVDETMKDKAVFNSSISSDYFAESSRSTSRGKQNAERLEEIQAMAKKDLEIFAESLKEQLKAQLGTSYNEAEAQKYINDAINDTISIFTQNVYRKNQHGDYTTGSSTKAFLFADRTATSKGRYVYNVKSLIDTFVDCFNNASKVKSAAKLDPQKATYDKENVVTVALGNDYDRNQTEIIKGKGSDETKYAQLIELAKQDLKKVAAEIKNSLIAEGVPIDMSKVDAWLDDLILETIQDMKDAFQYCQPNGTVSGGGIASSIVGAGGTTAMALGGATALATAGTSIGAAVAGTTTTAYASVLAGTAAVSNSAALVGATGYGTTVAMTGSQFATVAGFSSAVPVVGWCVAGIAAVLGVLSFTTNIFGATYGKHNSDAGFFFERKSHSKSGKWGYDTQTLVNLFLAKVDSKIAQEKEDYKNKNNPNV